MRRLSLFLLLLVTSVYAWAQEQKDVIRQQPASTIPSVGTSVKITVAPQFVGIGRRAQANEAPPKAVLVELLSRQNQREYLIKARPDLLPIFDRDVAEVNRRIVKDWSLYFKFCPVYFFSDTLSDKVRDGEWDGALFDSAFQQITNPALARGEKNIYIAYFGSPIPQPETGGPTGPLGQNREHDGDDVTSLIRERLVVMDHNFRVLGENKPRTNYVRAIRPKNMSGSEYSIYRRSLTYNSSRWYIDYRPIAYSYDATLRRYFR